MGKRTFLTQWAASHSGGEKQIDLHHPRAEVPATRPWWLRLLVSLGAGAVFGVLVALALAVVDLYLSGHGHRPISSPLVDWAAWGVHLSLADAIFLGAVAAGAVITWRRMAQGGG